VTTDGDDERALVLRLRAAGCVFAEEEAALLREAASGADLDALVDRRVAGEPLEHLLGWVDFAGMRVRVAPGVFVPRRRTSYLVDLAAGYAAGLGRPPVVVDLCCGSGALGLVVAVRCPGTELHAVDVDEAAVACAARNLEAVAGRTYCGDLVDPLPAALRRRVDLLLANVPYVPTDSVALMPPESRDHEPRHTVDGGADGLDVLRRVAALAPAWLAPGGRLLVETSEAQGDAAAEAARAAGLEAVVQRSEEHDATVLVGHAPG